LIPGFSIIFRFLVIALMALVVAMPISSLLSMKATDAIIAERRIEVFSQLQANHVDMTKEEEQLIISKLENEHFPIHVYKLLIGSRGGNLSMLICATAFLFPFLLLCYLRHAAGFEYAELNRNLLVHQIESDYAMTIEHSKHIQKNIYKAEEYILPNQSWLDPPFNTRGVAEANQYSFESESIFMERLKSI
jgi:hypothetical protein